MLWAAFLTCFFGFLRSGEITVPSESAYDPTVHLSLSDIALDSPTDTKIIQMHLKCSKTDPFRQGVSIHIGITGQALCPVSALLTFLAIRGNRPGPLFHFQDGSSLTKSKFTSKLRYFLTQAGIDSSLYAGHSFRIGAALIAAAKGVKDSLIQTLGRWKSSTYLAYVRIPPDNLAAISRIIAQV